MGTLATLEIIPNDEEGFDKAAVDFASAVADTITNGQAMPLLGIPNTIEVAEADEDTKNLQIEGLIRAGFREVFTRAYLNILSGIDVIPPGDNLLPLFADPTSALSPHIIDVSQIVSSITGKKAGEWVVTNLDSIIANADDIVAGIASLAEEDTEPLATALNQIDDEIDITVASEKLGELQSGSSESEESVDFGAVPFASIALDPEDINIDGLALPQGFIIRDPMFPNVNFALDEVFKIYQESMAELISECISGQHVSFIFPTGNIPGFIESVISRLFELINDKLNSETRLVSLKKNMETLLFSAVVATMTSLLISSIIVSLSGFLVNTGLITYSVGYLLNLIQ